MRWVFRSLLGFLRILLSFNKLLNFWKISLVPYESGQTGFCSVVRILLNCPDFARPFELTQFYTFIHSANPKLPMFLCFGETQNTCFGRTLQTTIILTCTNSKIKKYWWHFVIFYSFFSFFSRLVKGASVHDNERISKWTFAAAFLSGPVILYEAQNFTKYHLQP